MVTKHVIEVKGKYGWAVDLCGENLPRSRRECEKDIKSLRQIDEFADAEMRVAERRVKPMSRAAVPIKAAAAGSATIFPGRLREARQAAGLSQEQLALDVGYTERRVIYAYEAGKVSPTLDLTTKLAARLGVAPEWLAGWISPTENIK